MPHPFANYKIQLIGALVIIAVAIILAISDFKFPAPATNVTNTVNESSTNVNSLNINANNDMPTNTNQSAAYSFPGRLPEEKIINRQARIVMSKGEIVIKLDPAQAPLAVSNFVYLAEAGFYDGILWHRVENWVVQAGDPQTKDPTVNAALWGRGGPGYRFPDETVTGEYITGAVGMANSGPDTNGSQFFIVKEDATGLPKNYTIFGQVTGGLEVVTQLEVGDKIERLVIEAAS